jgi:transposase
LRFIGLDVHRDFCEIAISEGSKARSAGRVNTTPEALTTLGNSLAPDDRVILESTGNALEIARILEPFVSEVVIANPMQVRAISHAKVKTTSSTPAPWPNCSPLISSPASGSATNRPGCCAG